MQSLFRIWMDSVAKIVQKQQEIASISGENYNLFKVIHMTSNETSVHSAFIADLLNPKGLHGMGNKFLTLFLDTIDTHGFTFDREKCKVEIEKDIGTRTETTGGRLDIIVTNEADQAIIIENKIYAEDQEAQMLRYYNYAHNRYLDRHLLLYLSLDGKVHDTDVTTKGGMVEEGKQFYTISYKEDILNWLYLCRQLAVDKPLLREGISHYINLVKSLTNTNMNAELKKEMTDIIVNNPTYIQNLNVYTEAIEAAKHELTVEFWKALFAEAQDKDNLCLVKIEKDNKLTISSRPTIEDVEKMAEKFQLKGYRSKNYAYQFGFANLLGESGEEQLVAGIIIDSAISFRAFVKNSDGEIVPFKNIESNFKRLRNNWGDDAIPNWSKDLYISAAYPNNDSSQWSLGVMNNPTLNNMLDIQASVKTILREYDSFCANLKGMIE